MSKNKTKKNDVPAAVKDSVMEAYFMADRATELLYEARDSKGLHPDIALGIEFARTAFVEAFDALDYLVRPIGGTSDPKYTRRLSRMSTSEDATPQDTPSTARRLTLPELFTLCNDGDWDESLLTLCSSLEQEDIDADDIKKVLDVLMDLGLWGQEK